jgi:2-polyprenyl-6-methoxyphenol hydroxylase-like FAD-dependent oxidoreductase
MAGMLAARVLSEHFEHVTLLERDQFPEGTEHRRGLPQAHHLHALLARGLRIIEELFPGIRNELVTAGAEVIESGVDLAWLTPAGWGKRYQSEVEVLSFSRPFLDRHLRRRLAKIDNVEILPGCDVKSLAATSDQRNVRGVSFKQQDGLNATEVERFLDADLVVDASGRQSHAPSWLTRLGYDDPRETIVNAFLGYATRIYERPKQNDPGWTSIFLQAAPPERTRAGLLFPIEGNRWTLTLCGGDHDYAPVEEREFMEFAESLPSSMISEAIRNAKPLTPIRSFRNMQNRMRHYEEMAHLPGRFVLLGDAVCAFNPVYGQGMTIAAMGAMELGSALSAWKRELDTAFVKTFQKRLAKLNTLPWSLATGEDCRYRGTEGATLNWKARMMHAYVDGVIALTTRDTKVRDVWIRVFQMLKPPTSLFHPAILFKVIRDLIFRPRQKKALRTLVVSQASFAATSRD